jgi:hypothetical protein
MPQAASANREHPCLSVLSRNRFKPEFFPWKHSGLNACTVPTNSISVVESRRRSRVPQPAREQMATGSPASEDHAHFYSLLRESPSSIPASIKLMTMAEPP